jgi:tRNA(fMet)-specific endonuclease VapC
MLRYMLDTDVCIYVIKNRPSQFRERFNALEGQLCISVITLSELNFGAENSERRWQNLVGIERFTSRLTVMPFLEKAASHYGQVRAELRRSGQPIGPFDMLIGAHARSEGLILVTNNTREFERIEGLRVENWADGD